MITEYLDGAIQSLKVNSDNALARHLGISRQHISTLRKGASLPSDALMLRLAELATKSKEEALLDLAAARAASEDARNVYLALKNKVLAAVLVVFFMTAAAPAYALTGATVMVKNPDVQNYRLCDFLRRLNHLRRAPLYARVARLFRRLWPK